MREKVLLATGVVLGCAAAAQGTVITLSTHSSDETDAAVLDATLDFDVIGDMLSLSVTNTTSDPFEFNINEIYFNGSGNVLGLTPTSLPTDWEFFTSEMADGFGTFDFALINGVGEMNPSLIQPGEKLVFEFMITGTADKDDFVAEFSEGGLSAIAAAKFVNGPKDDSAFGAFIPAPGVLAALGVAGLLGRRRRRRTS